MGKNKVGKILSYNKTICQNILRNKVKKFIGNHFFNLEKNNINIHHGLSRHLCPIKKYKQRHLMPTKILYIYLLFFKFIYLKYVISTYSQPEIVNKLCKNGNLRFELENYMTLKVIRWKLEITEEIYFNKIKHGERYKRNNFSFLFTLKHIFNLFL